MTLAVGAAATLMICIACFVIIKRITVMNILS